LLYLLGIVNLRGKETTGGDWETSGVGLCDWTAWGEALGGAHVEYEGDNVKFTPETTTDIRREFDETARDTATDKLHEVFCVE